MAASLGRASNLYFLAQVSEQPGCRLLIHFQGCGLKAADNGTSEEEPTV